MKEALGGLGQQLLTSMNVFQYIILWIVLMFGFSTLLPSAPDPLHEVPSVLKV
jgi:hypothetical protein